MSNPVRDVQVGIGLILVLCVLCAGVEELIPFLKSAWLIPEPADIPHIGPSAASNPFLWSSLGLLVLFFAVQYMVDHLRWSKKDTK